MSDNKVDRQLFFLKLLQYPVLMLSIIFGMLMLQWVFDIDFSRLSKIGFEGVEFYEERAQNEVAQIVDLKSQINDLTSRLRSIEQEGRSSQSEMRRAEIQNFEMVQTVPDKTAELSVSPDPRKKTLLAGMSGYVWIGDLDLSSGVWSKRQIAWPGGKEIELTPEEMPPGSRCTVTGNLILRDGLPPNNETYYRDNKVIGAVPRGAIVKLIEKPVGIDREYAIQYWAKVEVNE